MASRARPAGKITTFFSYKGGVGRTMAVANVGFIAAMAGKRVLLMDWDLEAPGLAVYFRGVTDHEAAGNIRKAHGVLDLFTEWRDVLLRASKAEQVSALFKRFMAGAPFKSCACPLLPPARLPKGAKLDIIGAGSAMVGVDEPIPYAEALSRFHWSSFFDDFAGGAMLESLRSWARRNYDMILIDSRTGLADVAGICTMQLPDEVVLCFVLNRQNTEGVADIAASIRAARGNEIAIRLSPMRVSKDRPTEEADARARAHREMRNAGLDPQRIEEDMLKLSIGAAPNVPFYETLAPFVATSATADPLTFEYLRMTQELAGATFEAPRVEPNWIESVRRRLQPRMTTVEYLSSLENADPDRALEELDRFLDGALDADPSRELDTDYVEALVSAALEASDWLWSEGKELPILELAQKALLLLRQLHDIGEGDWRVQLVDALDEFDRRWTRPSIEAAIKGNSERDAILASGNQSSAILVRRANLRLRSAQLRRPSASFEQINLELAGAEELLNEISGPIQPEEATEIALGYAEIASYRAKAFAREPSLGNATEQWQRVLNLLDKPVSPRVRSLMAEAHLGLADLDNDSPAAIDHVMTATQLWRTSVIRSADQFARACAIVLGAPDADVNSVTFALEAFARPKNQRSIASAFVHSPGDGPAFARELEQLVLAMGHDVARRVEALIAVADMAEQQLHRLSRHGASGGSNHAAADRMITAYTSLTESLASAGAPDTTVALLRQQIDQLRRRTDRSAI
jgi:hypothetical protein